MSESVFKNLNFFLSHDQQQVSVFSFHHSYTCHTIHKTREWVILSWVLKLFSKATMLWPTESRWSWDCLSHRSYHIWPYNNWQVSETTLSSHSDLMTWVHDCHQNVGNTVPCLHPVLLADREWVPLVFDLLHLMLAFLIECLCTCFKLSQQSDCIFLSNTYSL